MRISIHDDLPPEASAMLQALYSRSPDSVEEHVKKVRERGPDKFMASFYIGYGHASIGDCGYTTLYVEDISILACKAIQDNPLFSGQETSTRYIDFSTRRLADPAGSVASRGILSRWIDFYTEAEPLLREHLVQTIERPPGKDAAAWHKAIAARTFDILRGFLPAGITSQTAWTTNLRQAYEHCVRLMHHPLEEVRQIGTACLEMLRQRYPSSFGQEITQEESTYLRRVGEHESYALHDNGRSADFEVISNVDNEALEASALEIIAARPRKALLPKSLGRFGRYSCRFRLDFGSFRDIQRHRGGICPMPLLTNNHGMHAWYLEQLPLSLSTTARQLLSDQAAAIAELARQGLNEFDLQYYQPMGMLVDCKLHYDLPQMVYVAELRSGKTVHPTLRDIAQRIGAALREYHPNLALYVDQTPDEFCLRRGEQDIVDLEVQAARSAA